MLKQKLFRDKTYGKWISENVPCCITGSTVHIVNHHIKGESYGSVKAPDSLQMALTHELHQELHQIGYRAFERKYGANQRAMVVETLLVAHKNGRLNVNEMDLPEWIDRKLFNE